MQSRSVARRCTVRGGVSRRAHIPILHTQCLRSNFGTLETQNIPHAHAFDQVRGALRHSVAAEDELLAKSFEARLLITRVEARRGPPSGPEFKKGGCMEPQRLLGLLGDVRGPLLVISTTTTLFDVGVPQKSTAVTHFREAVAPPCTTTWSDSTTSI